MGGTARASLCVNINSHRFISCEGKQTIINIKFIHVFLDAVQIQVQIQIRKAKKYTEMVSLMINHPLCPIQLHVFALYFRIKRQCWRLWGAHL